MTFRGENKTLAEFSPLYGGCVHQVGGLYVRDAYEFIVNGHVHTRSITCFHNIITCAHNKKIFKIIFRVSLVYRLHRFIITEVEITNYSAVPICLV